MSNIIVLKGKGNYIEKVTDAICSPGMGMELAPDGKVDRLQATLAEAAKGVAGLKIAVEDALQGKTVTQAYAVGDVCFMYEPLPGDEVQLLIKDGETIAIGDTILAEGGGSGLFIEAAGTETNYVAEALEALSPSGSNGLVACKILRV